MNYEISDSDLTKLVRNEKDNEALMELINRHSGIYVDMVKKFGCKSLSITEVGDIIDDKNYNIYKAAIDYDETRAKFSTYLATKTKFICLTQKTKNKRSKPHFSYDELDFFIESKDNTPEEFCSFSDSFSKIMNLISKNKDKRVEKIFNERYFGGEFNKLQPWHKISKKIGMSSQACINIHNKTIENLKKKVNNETVKF